MFQPQNEKAKLYTDCLTEPQSITEELNQIQSQNQAQKLLRQIETFINQFSSQKQYTNINLNIRNIYKKSDCLVFTLKRIIKFVDVSGHLHLFKIKSRLIKYLINYRNCGRFLGGYQKINHIYRLEKQRINKYIIQVFQNNHLRQCNYCCCSRYINIQNLDAFDQVTGIKTITQKKYPEFQYNQIYLKKIVYGQLNQGGGLILIAKVGPAQDKIHNYDKISPFTIEQADNNKKNVEQSFFKISKSLGFQSPNKYNQNIKIDIVKQLSIKELQNFKNFSNKRKYFIRVKLLNSKNLYQRLFLYQPIQKRNAYQLLMRNLKGQSWKLKQQNIYQFLQGYYKNVIRLQEYFDDGVYNKNHINTEFRNYIIKYSTQFYDKKEQQIENVFPQLKYDYCYILRLTSLKMIGLLKQLKMVIKQIEEDCVISVPFQKLMMKCHQKIVFISLKNQINSYVKQLQSKISGLQFNKLKLQKVEKRIDITFNSKHILPLKQVTNLQRMLRKSDLCSRMDVLRTQSGCQIEFSNQISSIFSLIYIRELSFPVKFIPVKCYLNESTSSNKSSQEDSDY